MDDYILFIEGALNIKDFAIVVQVPHSKHARNMVEALCFFGLQTLLGAHAHIEIRRILKHKPRMHFHVTVKGLKVGDQFVNDFFIYVQLPKSQEGNEAQAVKAMVEQGRGLYSFLGVYCKKIHIKRGGETLPGKLEELQSYYRID